MPRRATEVSAGCNSAPSTRPTIGGAAATPGWISRSSSGSANRDREVRTARREPSTPTRSVSASGRPGTSTLPPVCTMAGHVDRAARSRSVPARTTPSAVAATTTPASTGSVGRIGRKRATACTALDRTVVAEEMLIAALRQSSRLCLDGRISLGACLEWKIGRISAGCVGQMHPVQRIGRYHARHKSYASTRPRPCLRCSGRPAPRPVPRCPSRTCRCAEVRRCGSSASPADGFSQIHVGATIERIKQPVFGGCGCQGHHRNHRRPTRASVVGGPSVWLSPAATVG